MKLRGHSQAPARRRGSAMIAALLVVFAVATLSMIHVQLDLSKAREQRTAVDTKRAFYMAEAGLAEAFHGIVAGKSGNVGTADEPARFANGIFFTTAKEEGLGRVTLTSTGLCGAGRATLSIVIERHSSEVGAMGFFGDENVTVGENVLVDSYDSRNGAYSPGLIGIGGNTGAQARVGSNDSLMVGGATGSTYVYGDAQPGPTGVLVRGRSTTITGTTAPFLTATTLEPVEVPTYRDEGSIATSILKPLVTVPAGERAYGELHVGALSKIVVAGPARVVVGKLVVDGTGEFAVDARKGPVEIYVEDWLALKPGSKISTGGADPRSVSVLVAADAVADQDRDGVADQPVVLGATGSFQGTLYAPGAAVSIPSTMQVFGAVSAKRLTIQAGGQMHFDVSLLEAGESESGLPELVGWRLVELPNVPVVKLRYDALRSLLDAGVTPVKSATAHFDIGVQPP